MTELALSGSPPSPDIFFSIIFYSYTLHFSSHSSNRFLYFSSLLYFYLIIIALLLFSTSFYFFSSSPPIPTSPPPSNSFFSSDFIHPMKCFDLLGFFSLRPRVQTGSGEDPASYTMGIWG
jgi:hypothetical protein